MPSIVDFSGTKDEVHAEARKVRDSYFRQGGSPRDAFEDILGTLNGKIEYTSANAGETLEVTSSGFTIYLPISSSPARDNFTVAHELGHYFLHTDLSGTETIIHTRNGSNEREWQANWFAAELLMPRDSFVHAFQRFNKDPEAIASYFNVSGAAARVRMSVLGLV